MNNTVKFEIGQRVKALNNKPLPENEVAPNLKLGEEYDIMDIIEDKEGNQHLNVGLKSYLNYVTSYETKERLPDGDKVHWCHPSRFELLN